MSDALRRESAVEYFKELVEGALAHQRIAAACAQNPPSVDIFNALHDDSLLEGGGLSSGYGRVGCGVVVGDPESIG